MSLDLNDLMMTEEELEDEDFPQKAAGVADRAVAKFAWGIADILHADDGDPWHAWNFMQELRDALETAGIQRPGAKP